MALVRTDRGIRIRRILLCSLSLAGYGTSKLTAQYSGFVAGISSYHLVSSGYGMAVGGYLRRPVNRSFSFLGSLSFLTDHTDREISGIRYTETLNMIFPEARVEVSAHMRGLAPFAGVGGGLGIGFGRQFGGLTLHAIGGARLTVSTRITITTAMVVRAVDPGRGHTLDALIGLELVGRGK